MEHDHSSIHCGPGSDITNLNVSGALPGSGTLFDGAYHTWGALITPSYVATYYDGTLLWSGNNALYLNHLTTATNPPSASASGSFGYQVSQYPAAVPLIYSTYQWNMFLGLEILNQSGYTVTQAQFPMTMSLDWLRHSSLYPATGGACMSNFSPTPLGH